MTPGASAAAAASPRPAPPPPPPPSPAAAPPSPSAAAAARTAQRTAVSARSQRARRCVVNCTAPTPPLGRDYASRRFCAVRLSSPLKLLSPSSPLVTSSSPPALARSSQQPAISFRSLRPAHSRLALTNRDPCDPSRDHVRSRRTCWKARGAAAAWKQSPACCSVRAARTAPSPTPRSPSCTSAADARLSPRSHQYMTSVSAAEGSAAKSLAATQCSPTAAH